MSDSNSPYRDLGLPEFLYQDTIQPDTEVISISPFFMGEIHFDSYDVRTHTKLTGDFCLAFPVMEMGHELTWLPEMILQVNRALLVPIPPFGLDYVVPSLTLTPTMITDFKIKILEAITRHVKFDIFFNPELSLYSQTHETRADFEIRCRNLLQDSASEEMSALKVKYQRRLEGLKEKFQSQPFIFIQDDPTLSFIETKRKQIIYETREALTRLFLSSPDSEKPTTLPFSRVLQDELEDSAIDIYTEARAELQDLKIRFDRQVSNIENYQVHIQYGDLDFYQLSILWKPFS